MKKIIALLMVTLTVFFCTSCAKKENFNKELGDVTAQLENLGVNNFKVWDDSTYELIISRNPYDMILDGDMVYVSGGNYDSNTGPVPINAYKNNSNKPNSVVALPTEQVNEFYQYDGFTFALGIDPKEWGNGELYFSPIGSGKWTTIRGAFKKNIHCYDMVKFKGNYYFCGSNIGYATLNGKDGQEISKAAIFKMVGDFDETKKSPDFLETFARDKNGNIINFNSCISTYKTSDGTEIQTTSVPRFYQFFVFNDKLLAYCFGSYKEHYDGLYVLNEQNGIFEYSTEYKAGFLNKLYSETVQDRSKIEHDFLWGDRYYFIASNGFYCTENFKTYKTVKLNDFEDYTVHDVLLKADYALCLAAKKNREGKHTNVVLKTNNFENYTALFNFDTTLLAKSFEFSNGYFYFGLGFASEYDITSANIILGEKTPQFAKDCGTILRYKYK